MSSSTCSQTGGEDFLAKDSRFAQVRGVSSLWPGCSAAQALAQRCRSLPEWFPAAGGGAMALVLRAANLSA